MLGDISISAHTEVGMFEMLLTEQLKMNFGRNWILMLSLSILVFRIFVCKAASKLFLLLL